jgi:hypothetical protein
LSKFANSRATLQEEQIMQNNSEVAKKAVYEKPVVAEMGKLNHFINSDYYDLPVDGTVIDLGGGMMVALVQPPPTMS